jgi:predicted phage tail protein
MKDNQKLSGLQSQIGDMHSDFEDMKRTREEAKKQLEAKFLDIYKKISDMKEAIAVEAKRVNDSLQAFQSKFEYLLNELKEYTDKQFIDEKNSTIERFLLQNERMSFDK